ncbi:Hypothetical protein PBC10988_26270 [Planctomycetales bacterium 10988]|nr:Hypothetical protein PBC10988_26270 [Planctomycetales bacterium 10988]
MRKAQVGGSKRQMMHGSLRMVACWALGSLFLIGCSSESAEFSEAENPDSKVKTTSQRVLPVPETPTGPSAKSVLEKMVQAYRQASAYQDEGFILSQFQSNGQWVRQELAPFSVRFERPNRLWMIAHSAHVRTTNEQLQFWVQSLPQQLLIAKQPAKLAVEHLYFDPVFRQESIQLPVGSHPVIGLLLAEEPLKAILQDSEEPQLLASEFVADRSCYLVRLKRPEGKLDLWIDQENYLLRRMAVPMEDYKAQVDPEGALPGLQISVELKQAEFLLKLPEIAFPQPPQEAEEVRYFVPLTEPQPPSQLLGKSIFSFQLQRDQGATLGRQDLAGKPAVLQTWSVWNQTSLMAITQLEQARLLFVEETAKVAPAGSPAPPSDAASKASSSAIRWIGVNTDGEQLDLQQFKEATKRLSIQMLNTRDMTGSFQKSLPSEEIPQTLVVDAEGVVQWHDIGFYPLAPEMFVSQLQRIQAGEDLTEEIREGYQTAKQEYENRLAEASYHQSNPPQQEPSPPVASEGERQVVLVHRWSNSQLKAPGNLTVIAAGDSIRKPDPSAIWVHEGWQTLAKLNREGNLDGIQRLDLPADLGITQLVPVTDRGGAAYWVGWTTGGAQLLFFDAKWQLLWKWPKDPQQGSLSEVQAADLDGDGRTELLVSLFGEGGIHQLSLSGEVLWSNDQINHILGFAVVGPDPQGKRYALIVDGEGALVPINSKGQTSSPVKVGQNPTLPAGRYLTALISADLNEDRFPELLGVAASPEGEEILLGIGPDGKEQWSFVMETALKLPPVRSILPGRLAEEDQGIWIIVDRENRLYFLGEDGSPIDRFQFSQDITGIDLFQEQNKTWLVVSSILDGRASVDCWEMRVE